MRTPALVTATCLLVLNTGVATSAAPSETADAAAPSETSDQELRLLDLNFGGNGFNRGSTGAPVDDLVEKIVATEAEIISLNEVCYTQWLAITDRLRQEPGYQNLHGHYATSNYDVPNCRSDVSHNGAYADPDGQYVAGVISRYEMSPVMFDGRYHGPHSEDKGTGTQPHLALGYDWMRSSIPRHRKMPCGDVSVPRFEEPIRACSVHSEVPGAFINEENFPHVPDIADDPNYGRTINEAQHEVIRDAVEPWMRQMPVVLMGDFNNVPWHPSMDSFYRSCGGDGEFLEIDGRDPRNIGDVKHWDAGPFWPAKVDACPYRKGEWTFGEEGQADDPSNPFNSNRRIDFIFVDSHKFRVDEDSGESLSTDYSDHRYVSGTVALK